MVSDKNLFTDKKKKKQTTVKKENKAEKCIYGRRHLWYDEAVNIDMTRTLKQKVP